MYIILHSEGQHPSEVTIGKTICWVEGDVKKIPLSQSFTSFIHLLTQCVAARAINPS